MFQQEIRWSGRAMAALFGLYLFVLASVWWPLLSPGVPETTVWYLIGVGLVTTAIFLGTGVTFGTLRLSIGDERLTVGFGPFREQVPLARIVACRSITYAWFTWGGWGIRMGHRARLYNVPGDGGRAVELNLEDGSRLLFSSPDPEAVCRALQERRPGIWEISTP